MQEHSGLFGELASDPYHLLSFVGGLFILVLFAYRQLNQPSYELMPQQQKLLATLGPRDLSGRSAFVSAYMFYVALLVIIYAFFTFMVPFVPALLQLGPLNPTDVVGYDPAGSTINKPAIPLLVSLMMIGLGPSVPILQDIEETFRRMSHRLIGVPDHIWDIGQRIRNAQLDLSEATKTEEKVRRRAAEIAAHAEPLASSRQFDIADVSMSQLKQVLERIGLLRAWLFSHALSSEWPLSTIRHRFSKFHDALRDEVEEFYELAQRVVDETEQHRVTAESAGDNAPQLSEYRTMSERYIVNQWSGLLRQGNAILDNLSILLAIYAINSPEIHTVRSKLLQHTIAHARSSRQRPIIDLILFAILAIFVIVFVGGFVGVAMGYVRVGASTNDSWGPAAAAMVYGIGTVSLYLPASLIGWFIRVSQSRRMRWVMVGDSDAGLPVAQYLRVFFWSYAVSVVAMSGLTIIIMYFATVDKSTVLQDYIATNQSYDVLMWSLLGASHACFLCIWLDLAQTRGVTPTILAAAPVVQGIYYTAFAYFMSSAQINSQSVFSMLFAGLIGLTFAFVTLYMLRHYLQRVGAPVAAAG